MKQIFTTILILMTGFNVQAISEREFVEQLKSTHPFFEQQALSSQIKQVEKHLTTANEDWIISINGNYKNENASDIRWSTYTN